VKKTPKEYVPQIAKKKKKSTEQPDKAHSRVARGGERLNWGGTKGMEYRVKEQNMNQEYGGRGKGNLGRLVQRLWGGVIKIE